MKHFKTLSVAAKLLLLFVLVCGIFFIPSASAQSVGVIDSNADMSGSLLATYITTADGSLPYVSAVFQSFSGDGQSLSDVDMYVMASGSVAAGFDPQFQVEIWSATGTSVYTPNVLLATSQVIPFSLMPTSASWVSFSFSSAVPTVAGTSYVLVLRCVSDGLSNSGATPALGVYRNAGVFVGNGGYMQSGAWNTFAVGTCFLFSANAGALFPVVYDGNGFTGGVVPVDPNSPYAENMLVTVLGQGSLVRDGYDFLGWAFSSSAVVPNFLPGDTFAKPAGTTTLFAVWSESSVSPPSGGESGVVGTGVLFVLFGVIVILIWVLAVVRQTVGMLALSTVFWFAFSFSLLVVGDLGVGWTEWFAYLGILLGVVMVLVTFYEVGKSWQASVNGRVEEAVL